MLHILIFAILTLIPYFVWRYVSKNINIAGCMILTMCINIIYSLATWSFKNFLLCSVGLIVGMILMFAIDYWGYDD